MNQTKLNQEKYQKDNKSSCLIKAHHSWKKSSIISFVQWKLFLKFLYTISIKNGILNKQ